MGSNDIKTEKRNTEFIENNARVLALIDGFESLYDVNLKTGEYELFVKGQIFSNAVNNKLVERKEFFKDSIKNIDVVVYEEDREEFKKVINREYFVKALSHRNSFEYYYRLLFDGNPVWFKMRVVYKDDDKQNVIIGLFNAENEIMLRKQQELARKELIAQMANGEFVAIVNLLTNDVQVITQNDYFAQNYDLEDDYLNNIQKYLGSAVFEPDRKRVLESLKRTNIVSRLMKEKEFTVQYRDISYERPLWYEMRIARLSKTEILLGVANKNNEILINRFKDSIFDDQYALFAVDFDTKMLTVLKKSPWDDAYEVGDCKDYSEVMRRIAGKMDDKAREFYLQLSDINFLQKELSTDGKHTYSYHSNFVEGDKWVTISAYTIAYHDDKTPATCSLCFSVLDTLGADRQEMQRQLQENYAILEGMASEYVAIFSINLDSGTFENFMIGDRVKDISGLCNSFSKVSDVFKAFLESDFLHPECRKTLSDFYQNDEKVKAELKGKKKISIRFRRKFGDEYLWMEMSIIKCEETNEEAHNAIVCFVVCDDEVRSEQAVADCLNILENEKTPNESINDLLALAGDFYGADRVYVFEYDKKNRALDYTYEWCKESVTPYLGKVKNMPPSEIDKMLGVFDTQGAFYMDLSELEGTPYVDEKLSKEYGVESIAMAPIMKADEIVGIIGVNNPKKTQNDIKIIKVVASVAYSEILRRREDDEEHITLGKLSDTFVSVYYVDLDNDYMRTWKIDKEYEQEYGTTRNYTDSIRGYIQKNVAQKDRERCCEMTGTEYILAQFKDKERFSIEMTDISGKKERIFIFDYIKVNDIGTKFVISCRDATESLANQKAQQDRLKEALEMARSANNAKSDFLFNMSHDIRTPMNAILGYTDIALRHFDDEEKAKDSLDKIKTAGGHLLNLINDILEMSRIESGNLEISENPMDIKKAVEGVAQMSKSLALQKSINFILDMGEIKNTYIYADELHINEVLINLISNAVKYTPIGGKVTYFVRQVGEAKKGVAKFRFKIADTGIGMSEDFQKHLFEAFTREESATVAKTEGAGLGLSIVKKIVDLAGGTIKVESTLNKGSTFTIEIDFKVLDEAAIEKYLKSSKGSEKLEGLSTLEGKRVLLVEDNEMNREIAQEILEDVGVVVEAAQDGAEAVSLVTEHGVTYYDVILMDIQMPVMNGYEATKKIRELRGGQYVPIIALSANAFDEDIQKSLEVGMNAHIAKPIDMNKLLDTMRGMI